MRMIDDHDIQQFLNGSSSNAHHFLGAHFIRDDQGKIVATEFSVYAPHAKEVRLVADFNNYEGWKHVLTKVHPHGFFRIEIPGNLEWATYKYEIHTHKGQVLYKADPFAYFSEERPSTGSKVYHIDGYPWHDQKWHYEKKNIMKSLMNSLTMSCLMGLHMSNYCLCMSIH